MQTNVNTSGEIWNTEVRDVETGEVLEKITCTIQKASEQLNSCRSLATSLDGEYTSARSCSGTFPSTHIEYLGQAVIEAEYTASTSDSFTISAAIGSMISYGFSYSTTSETTYCFRKPISIHGEFYTY